MSKDPESVPFVRRVLQISQTDERWFLLARHAAVVDRCTYRSPFTWVRQVSFLVLLFLLPLCGVTMVAALGWDKPYRLPILLYQEGFF